MLMTVLTVLVIVAVGLVVVSFVKEWLRGPEQPVHVTVDSPKDGRGDRLYDPRNAQPIPIGAAACIHRWDAVKDEVLDVGHQKKMVVILRCTECGLLHECIETTDPAPPPPKVDPPRSECRHQWSVEKSVELESAYEQMRETIKLVCGSKAPGQPGSQSRTTWEQVTRKLESGVLPDPDKSEAWVFRKEYVQVRTCQKCGEVLVIKASNIPDAKAPKE